VLAELHKERPTVRLVYVTPEKLAKSDALWSCLDDLYSRACTRWIQFKYSLQAPGFISALEPQM
jgi:hypothetical protein